MNSAVKLISVCFLFQGVWCREFSISLPETVEALRGLCVLIPCSFDINEQYDEDLQGNPTGIWLKGGTDSNRVFNSKVTKENKIEGEILGDLLMKNCTTIFYDIRLSDGGDYSFRLEATEGLKYTYTSSVIMSVRDSPISPSITLYKEDQGELEVQNEVLEGTSLSLICSARSPPCLLRPPSFSWNFLLEERRPEQNHNTSFSSSQLNFIASHLHHGLQFTCTATYQLQNQNKSAQSSHTLQVLYAPRNTSVSASPSASVLLGSSVSLSCSSDANPAVLNFTWYRENGEQIGTGNHLTINTNDSTHSGLYYCRAQNQHGDQNSSVHLDLQYAPQVSFSSSCNSTQDLIMCFCEVDGNPAPTLEWHLSDQSVSPSGMMSIQVESVDNMGLRSFITIHQSFIDTPTLQCVSSNHLGVDTHLFHPIESGRRHTAEPALGVLSVVLLLCVGAIGFLLYKIKQLSRKINVLQREDPAPSLELSDFEALELNLDMKGKKDHS